jgi:nucleoside-diphosphate-sugar epimerase
MSENTSFWRGMRCLVTGGMGFIGSHLCRQLYDLGARVMVIDREPCHEGTLFYRLNANRDIATIQCDLSEATAVDVIRQIKPDYIFHLAALPYAPYTTRHPREAYAANVVSTVNALEGARLSDTRRFILASSACVFGAAQHSPLRTDDTPYAPEHYYSVTKQDAERQVRAFHNWYGINATVCRFGNVYGPGDRHFGRIIPQVCRQLIKERRETIELKRSGGDSVFEFLYVDDAVKAFASAGARESIKLETWQFSGGDESRTTILKLAEKISRLLDGKTREIGVNTSNPERRVEKYLDTEDTRRELNWESDWNLNAGLSATVEWYKRYINYITPYTDTTDRSDTGDISSD